MDSTQRQAVFRGSLQKAIQTNEEIVIFEDPASGKFVQFAVSAPEKNLIVDVPLDNLTKQEYDWLGQHMEIMTDSKGEPLSFQKLISTIQVDYAVNYTEWIFTKIFQLPKGFSVTAQVFT